MKCSTCGYAYIFDDVIVDFELIEFLQNVDNSKQAVKLQIFKDHKTSIVKYADQDGQDDDESDVDLDNFYQNQESCQNNQLDIIQDCNSQQNSNGQIHFNNYNTNIYLTNNYTINNL